MYSFTENKSPFGAADANNPLLVSEGVNIKSRLFDDIKHYRVDGLRHFTAQGVPLLLFDNLIRFIGEVRLANVLLGEGKPALNFEDIANADEMKLNEAEFANYLEANYRDLSRALRTCVGDRGPITTYQFLVAGLSDVSKGAVNEDIIARVVAGKDISDIAPAAIEALARLNFLIDKLGEYEFRIKSNEDALYANNHSLRFFNNNHTVITSWIAGCLHGSGQNTVTDYLRANFPQDFELQSGGDLLAGKLEDGVETEDQELQRRRYCATSIMRVLGRILDESLTSYTENNLLS